MAAGTSQKRSPPRPGSSFIDTFTPELEPLSTRAPPARIDSPMKTALSSLAFRARDNRRRTLLRAQRPPVTIGATWRLKRHARRPARSIELTITPTKITGRNSRNGESLGEGTYQLDPVRRPSTASTERAVADKRIWASLDRGKHAGVGSKAAKKRLSIQFIGLRDHS